MHIITCCGNNTVCHVGAKSAMRMPRPQRILSKRVFLPLFLDVDMENSIARDCGGREEYYEQGDIRPPK